MKNALKILIYGLVLLLVSVSSHSQSRQDSSSIRDTSRRDTSKFRRSQQLALLFADTAKLTTSDYQLLIERTFILLNNVANKSELGLPVTSVKDRLADSDSTL